jgi:hypothetical protein
MPQRDAVIEFAKTLLKAPVHAYRWTLKPLIGMECRHLPTCSEYALEALYTHGAWRYGRGTGRHCAPARGAAEPQAANDCNRCGEIPDP